MDRGDLRAIVHGVTKSHLATKQQHQQQISSICRLSKLPTPLPVNMNQKEGPVCL